MDGHTIIPTKNLHVYTHWSPDLALLNVAGGVNHLFDGGQHPSPLLNGGGQSVHLSNTESWLPPPCDGGGPSETAVPGSPCSGGCRGQIALPPGGGTVGACRRSWGEGGREGGSGSRGCQAGLLSS